MVSVKIITPKDGWILSRYARVLAERAEGSGLCVEVDTDTPDTNFDWVYFCHYHMYRPVDNRVRTAALFTHLERPGHLLHQRWFEVQTLVDQSIAMSLLYLNVLPRRTAVIPPPAYIPIKSPTKVRVGICAHLLTDDNSYRKGADMIQLLKVLNDDAIELVIADGTISESDMPQWYEGIDVLLVTSRYEGGPMPALEAAIAGKTIVAPLIGTIPELLTFYKNLRIYEAGNFRDLVRVLQQTAEYQRVIGSSQANSYYAVDKWFHLHYNLFIGD